MLVSFPRTFHIHSPPRDCFGDEVGHTRPQAGPLILSAARGPERRAQGQCRRSSTGFIVQRPACHERLGARARAATTLSSAPLGAPRWRTALPARRAARGMRRRSARWRPPPRPALQRCCKLGFPCITANSMEGDCYCRHEGCQRLARRVGICCVLHACLAAAVVRGCRQHHYSHAGCPCEARAKSLEHLVLGLRAGPGDAAEPLHARDAPRQRWQPGHAVQQPVPRCVRLLRRLGRGAQLPHVLQWF